jgi:hypothetical protein
VTTENIVIHVFESTLDGMGFLSGDLPSSFGLTILSRPIVNSYWDLNTVYPFLNLPKYPSFSLKAGIDAKEKCLSVVWAEKYGGTEKSGFELFQGPF